LQFLRQSAKQSVAAALAISGLHCHDIVEPVNAAAAENKNERRGDDGAVITVESSSMITLLILPAVVD
jgi:hypothetical protein